MEQVEKKQHYAWRWAKLGALVGLASALGEAAQQLVTHGVHQLFH